MPLSTGYCCTSHYIIILGVQLAGAAAVCKMSLMLRKWILNSIIKSQPAKKPIVQLSRIESLPGDSQLHGHFKLACISDKEKFIRAVFTKDSLAQLEEKGSSLEDIRGGLISLQDYAMIASIGTDRRFSEYFVEVHKFNFIGGERNMPIPTVTNINLDERVQSKLAQLWREEHSNDRADSHQYSVTVYSQMEDTPQLSQDELSMLLVAMSEQSQVDSIEAISASQLFELENIPGWLKPERDIQLIEQASTQGINYATPLIGETFMTALSRSDGSSHDTPTSDAAFKTPPEGFTTSPLAVNEDTAQQQGGEVQQMNDNEEPIDLTTMSPPLSNTLLRIREAIQSPTPVQQLSVEGEKNVTGILEQAVQNVSAVLSQSILVLCHDHDVTDSVEPTGAVHESSLACNKDDMDVLTEISRSQDKDLNAVWAEKKSSLPSLVNGTTIEQPFSDGSSDILPASDTPNNRHNCNDNDVSNNGCPEQKTATPSRRQDQLSDTQFQNQQQQQVTRGNWSTDKGKGGTTKDIYQVGEHFNRTNGTTHADKYDVIDDDISISSSQKDELERQWVEVGNDHLSSLETFEDLHPFQLTSLPDPSKKVTDVHQPVTVASENEPGPSGIVAMDTTGSDFVLNQEAKRRRMVTNDNGMDIDSPDQRLLSQAEATVTSPAPAKMQTSLVSTAAITRLLDVSNKIPPVNGAIGNKAILQSSGAAGNTRLTASRTMISNHNRTQPGNSKSDPQDLITHKESVITTHDDTDCSSDIVNPKECLDDQSSYHFKPLTNEEDIDEFIDNYWMLQQLRTYSF